MVASYVHFLLYIQKRNGFLSYSQFFLSLSLSFSISFLFSPLFSFFSFLVFLSLFGPFRPSPSIGKGSANSVLPDIVRIDSHGAGVRLAKTDQDQSS